jgi:hypothetical protein
VKKPNAKGCNFDSKCNDWQDWQLSRGLGAQASSKKAIFEAHLPIFATVIGQNQCRKQVFVENAAKWHKVLSTPVAILAGRIVAPNQGLPREFH